MAAYHRKKKKKKGKKRKKQMRNKQAAASTILRLPDDVISEILSWVPAKPLLRFRWVCKYWFSLISSPSFVKLQLHHSTYDIMDNTSVLIYSTPNNRLVLRSFNAKDEDEDPAPLKLPPPLLDNCGDFKILGSCHGLLCIQFSIHSLPIMICVWNPCTSEIKMLPKPPSRNGFISLGFGYNRRTDDYEVIKNAGIYCKEEQHMDIIVDVYRLRANSWKTIICKIKGSFFPSDGVYANGAIYWSPMCKLGNIIRFDRDKEEYSVLSWPNISKYTRLGEYKGCLAILDVLFTEKSLNIWVMKEYDGPKEGSWVKLFTIPNPILVGSGLSYHSVLKDNEILAETDDGYLIWYPKYDKIRYLLTDAKGRGDVKYRGYRIYTESLVSLNPRVHNRGSPD